MTRSMTKPGLHNTFASAQNYKSAHFHAGFPFDRRKPITEGLAGLPQDKNVQAAPSAVFFENIQATGRDRSPQITFIATDAADSAPPRSR